MDSVLDAAVYAAMDSFIDAAVYAAVAVVVSSSPALAAVVVVAPSVALIISPVPVFISSFTPAPAHVPHAIGAAPLLCAASTPSAAFHVSNLNTAARPVVARILHLASHRNVLFWINRGL